jgi:hypothetical protein
MRGLGRQHKTFVAHTAELARHSQWQWAAFEGGQNEYTQDGCVYRTM